MSTRNQKIKAEKEKQKKATQKEIDELKVLNLMERRKNKQFKIVKIGHNIWKEVEV